MGERETIIITTMYNCTLHVYEGYSAVHAGNSGPDILNSLHTLHVYEGYSAVHAGNSGPDILNVCDQGVICKL